MYREFFEEISGEYPIDKLSILVTVAFSALMLREHVSGRYLLGIASICAGAVLMVIG